MLSKQRLADLSGDGTRDPMGPVSTPQRACIPSMFWKAGIFLHQ